MSGTSVSGGAPSPICGTNTGEHSQSFIYGIYGKKNVVILHEICSTVYVDLDGSAGGCVDLDFQLGGVAVGTSIVARQWSIKVSIVCVS